MNAYSQELRERIVRAVQGGMTRADAARQFMVSERTVRRYVRRYATTGTLAPVVFRHGPAPAIGPDQEEALLRQLAAFPNATLEEHCDRWREATGRAVSISTMCRAQQRVGWTRKEKSPPARRAAPTPYYSSESHDSSGKPDGSGVQPNTVQLRAHYTLPIGRGA